METTKGKLRNITTGILHTNIDDVYLFLEEYVGAKGIMTHQLGSAVKALTPILQTKLSDEWFREEWIKVGLDKVIEITDLTEEEKIKFWKEYEVYSSELWKSIKNKAIIVKI
jgi:hypothetical protein